MPLNFFIDDVYAQILVKVGMLEIRKKGRKAAITSSVPEAAKVSRRMAYTTQRRVVRESGAPTNLPFIIPSPLKIPIIETRTSLTAMLMMRRF